MSPVVISTTFTQEPCRNEQQALTLIQANSAGKVRSLYESVFLYLDPYEMLMQQLCWYENSMEWEWCDLARSAEWLY